MMTRLSRDAFAVAALQGLLAQEDGAMHRHFALDIAGVDTAKTYAQAAYTLAHAMQAERDKGTPALHTDALLDIIGKQHETMDELMARLIKLDPAFRPSQSRMWHTMVAGCDVLRQTGRL